MYTLYFILSDGLAVALLTWQIIRSDIRQIETYKMSLVLTSLLRADALNVP